MTQVTAKLNHLRMAPRKVRLVASMLKGLPVEDAENQLRFMAKRPAGPLLKLLKSAETNASHDFNLDKKNLYIREIMVNSGPTLKRWLPRAMGRATPLHKMTCHVILILAEREGVLKAVRKAPAKEVAPKVEEAKKEKVETAPEKEGAPKPVKPMKTQRVEGQKTGLAKRTLGFGRKIFRRKAV